MVVTSLVCNFASGQVIWGVTNTGDFWFRLRLWKYRAGRDLKFKSVFLCVIILLLFFPIYSYRLFIGITYSCNHVSFPTMESIKIAFSSPYTSKPLKRKSLFLALILKYFYQHFQMHRSCHTSFGQTPTLTSAVCIDKVRQVNTFLTHSAAGMCVSLRAAFFSCSLNTDPCMQETRSQRRGSRQHSVTQQQRPNAERCSALFTSAPPVCSGSQCAWLTFQHLPLILTTIMKSLSAHREPLGPDWSVSRDTFLTFL